LQRDGEDVDANASSPVNPNTVSHFLIREPALWCDTFPFRFANRLLQLAPPLPPSLRLSRGTTDQSFWWTIASDVELSEAVDLLIRRSLFSEIVEPFLLDFCGSKSYADGLFVTRYKADEDDCVLLDVVVVVVVVVGAAAEERFPTRLLRNCSIRHRLDDVVVPAVAELSKEDVFIVFIVAVVVV
jgi:hypothetical protein